MKNWEHTIFKLKQPENWHYETFFQGKKKEYKCILGLHTKAQIEHKKYK